MIILKYDTLIAVQAGYTDPPHHVMIDLGYKFLEIDVEERYGKKSVPSVMFFEVDQAIEPLPPFLEKSDFIDGRFDPRISVTNERIVPDPIDLDGSVIHFHQDPMTFMTVDYGPKGSKRSSFEDEENERDRIQGEKAKRSADRRK